MSGVHYIGPDPCPVRIGDRRLERGEIVTEPPDVVAELGARADFETVQAPTKKPARPARRAEPGGEE